MSDSGGTSSSASVTVDVVLGDAVIQRMAEAALNDNQRGYIEGQTPAVRELAWSWVMAAMRATAHFQVESCFRAGVNQTALERLVGYAQMEVERRQYIAKLASQLVGAGAGFMVAQALLPGLGKADFVRLRREQGQAGQQPARKLMGEDESARIYRQWQALGKPGDAEGLLELHRESGQPLTVLWGLVQDWQCQTTVKGKG
jgi:hypothetical protein